MNDAIPVTLHLPKISTFTKAISYILIFASIIMIIASPIYILQAETEYRNDKINTEVLYLNEEIPYSGRWGYSAKNTFNEVRYANSTSRAIGATVFTVGIWLLPFGLIFATITETIPENLRKITYISAMLILLFISAGQLFNFTLGFDLSFGNP